MKKLVLIGSMALTLLLSGCAIPRAPHCGDGYGVITKMAPVNLAHTSTGENSTVEGIIEGASQGSASIPGMIVGGVAGGVVAIVGGKRSQIDGYIVTIQMDDGVEVVRKIKRTALPTKETKIGSRVEVDYSVTWVRIFVTNEPFPAKPVESVFIDDTTSMQ